MDPKNISVNVKKWDVVGGTKEVQSSTLPRSGGVGASTTIFPQPRL